MAISVEDQKTMVFTWFTEKIGSKRLIERLEKFGLEKLYTHLKLRKTWFLNHLNH